jgi:hypothetical protein
MAVTDAMTAKKKTHSPKHQKTLVNAPKSYAIKAASVMPELSHWKDRSKPWTPDQSEVMQWLISQPAISNWVLSLITKEGAIGYDPELKTWKGLKEASK